jgi:hypothetical protein
MPLGVNSKRTPLQSESDVCLWNLIFQVGQWPLLVDSFVEFLIQLRKEKKNLTNLDTKA